MPETVLAGPDGQPAVDAQTGQPLTIEELLRRRGLVAYGGNYRFSPPDPAGTAAAAQAQGQVATAKGMAPNAGGVVSRGGGMGPQGGGGAPTVVDPNDPTQTPVPTTSAGGNDAGSGNSLLPWLLGAGATTGAGTLLYQSLKNKRASAISGAGPDDPQFGSPRTGTGTGTTAPNRGSQIVEGEYTEVPRQGQLEGAVRQHRNQLTGGTQRQLPAPQRRLPASHRENARGRAAQAASGTSAAETIEGIPPIRTISEDPAAGVARQLGISPEMLKIMQSRRGLGAILGRALP